MRVDQAGKQRAAGRVDRRGVRGCGNIDADFGNAVVADENIGVLQHAVAGEHARVAEDQGLRVTGGRRQESKQCCHQGTHERPPCL
jgi:hypothetical protein